MDETLRAMARKFNAGRTGRDVLSTRRIVFLVVAAAAPLAAMIGNMPLALGRGNGAGTPAAFLFAALVLLCFAVGYAAMSRRVVNTGAFYTYVALGLGKPLGVGAAFVAMIAYLSYTFGLSVFFGYFINLIAAPMGIDIPWVGYAAAGTAVIAVMGFRSIDLSSKLLGALMIAELGVLIVFDLCVLFTRGAAALPIGSFAPHVVFDHGLGVALTIAFTSFIGFESAALYGEEAAEPTRTIPKATYASVALIGIFYLVTVWITVGAVGVDQTTARADQEGGLLMFSLFTQYCGKTASDLMGVLFCSSLLASYLAIHNAATRYLFALSRERLLPPALGRFHPVRYAPSNASLAVTLLTVACLVAFAAGGVDPYKTGVPLTIGTGTLGIIFLQGMAAVAIVVYFTARRKTERVGGIVFGAILGALGLLAAATLVAVNFELLTTDSVPGVLWLLTIFPVAVVAGIAFALWLRRARPEIYGALAQVDLRADMNRPGAKPVHYDGKYLIVGAGPCGLLAARAFKRAGIPYDHLERHTEVGGIWDIDNPGSSMYESAHFISSKYTSGFFGMPMPEDYPDYPSHRQILSYIRSFAEAFDLSRHIQFGVEVESAEPLGQDAGEGWKVTLGNGETRVYKGVVCANGVTWHPSVPTYPGIETFRGEVLHTVEYRSAASFTGRRALIVGCGNSGVDIACDAARHAEAAFISLRRGYHFVPKHLFGIPTDVFLSTQMMPPKGVVIPDDPTRMLEAVVGDLTRYGLPAPDHKALESHPIMNSQILHCLAHGDLKVKGPVKAFTPTGVVFADGSEEKVDRVLYATGYEYRIPYLSEDLFVWRQGRPEMYLNIFHPTLRGLAVVGFVEFASAGYQRFDEMAQMVAMDAYIEASGVGRGEWRRMKAEDRPNLRGTTHYVDSPRHANYVDTGVYRRVLSAIREKFSWPDPGDALYAPMRHVTRPGGPNSRAVRAEAEAV